MRRIFSVRNVSRYDEAKTGWDVYSLVFSALPLLALRNLNDYDEKRSYHSTLSWLCSDHKASYRVFNKTRFSRAVSLAIWNTWLYSGTRGVKLKRLEAICQSKLPKIVKRFTADMKKQNVERLADVNPKNKNYWKTVSILARAVSEVSMLKGANNPMFGSKMLHFLIPELFPIWDTEFIQNQVLVHEDLPQLPEFVLNELRDQAARAYAQYINLMLQDFACISTREYAAIEKRMLERACGKKYYQSTREVCDWHYDGLIPTVFEICLLGKWL